VVAVVIFASRIVERFENIRAVTSCLLEQRFGKGYGASHALGEVREVIERQIRYRKPHRRSKKPPDEAS